MESCQDLDILLFIRICSGVWTSSVVKEGFFMGGRNHVHVILEELFFLVATITPSCLYFSTLLLSEIDVQCWS